MSEWDEDRKTIDALTTDGWTAEAITYSDNFHYHIGDQRIDVTGWSVRGMAQVGDGGDLSALLESEAKFIAAARTRWPAALARIAELEAESAELRKVLSTPAPQSTRTHPRLAAPVRASDNPPS